MGRHEMKLAVLVEMKKWTDMLYPVGAAVAAREKCDEAWNAVCGCAHKVGLTEAVMSRVLFCRVYVNRWRDSFRVSRIFGISD